MAGNSQRRGATRKAGTKKGAQVGTGGHGRKALEGKGPTPKAEDRPGHVAHKRKKAEEKKASTSRRPSRPTDRTGGSDTTVVGRNAVLEALRMGMPATELAVYDRIDADERVTEMVALATDAGVTVREVRSGALDALAGGSPHQGVALTTKPFEYADLEDIVASATRRVLILDSITDPRNLGAMIRSAAAFGAAVVIPERRAASVTTAAWKVSVGAAAHVPVARVTNLVRAMETLKSSGYFAIGLDGEATTDLAESNLLDGKLLIVVGAEGAGIGRLVGEACDELVRIPMSDAAESLNASVAASIALYESYRA